jgi:hypothetical protein
MLVRQSAQRRTFGRASGKEQNERQDTTRYAHVDNRRKTFICNSLRARSPIRRAMKPDERVSGTAPRSVLDRRRTPRVEVVEAIHGQIRPHNVSITLIMLVTAAF